MDADSDSFHYIGYAESRDLIHWRVVNGINNPIVSTFPMTIAVDAQGVPSTVSGAQQSQFHRKDPSRAIRKGGSAAVCMLQAQPLMELVTSLSFSLDITLRNLRMVWATTAT